MKNPDLILAADLHIREDKPVCRADNYFEAQNAKVGFLRDLSARHGCPLVVAGDIFHHWKPSPFLLSWAIENLPNMIAIPGQHDLPQHRLELLNKSGLFVLEKAGKVTPGSWIHSAKYHLQSYPYGTPLVPIDRIKQPKQKFVAICHVMTWTKKKPWPGCEADGAKRLMKKMKGFDLIITGDNHKPFVVEKGE